MKPFVTVSFLDSEERTSVAFGSNPSWNEQMELPWAQGISRLIGGSISKEEYIYINVFDEDLMIQGTLQTIIFSYTFMVLTVILKRMLTRKANIQALQ